MKNYLIAMLMMVSVAGFSQKSNTDSISINRKKLSEVKFLHELIKNFPKDCKSISAEVVAKVVGVVKVEDCKSDELNQKVRSLLAKADSKTKVFLDLKTECPLVESKALKIILTD